MTALHPSFLETPLAHRALHDIADGRPENSHAAVRAALDYKFGIEIDLQISSDGEAMVFHDYALDRLTAETGPIASRSAEELGLIPLKGGAEGIPTLAEVLDIVGTGQPLLIEIKDQDGTLGPNVGALEEAAARALAGHTGPVAVMSFNPYSVIEMARILPDVPRGLVTEAFETEEWPGVPSATLARLREIPDFDRAGASFISHQASDLNSPRVADLKARGTPILCWTIRSPEQEEAARLIADNITFEGYIPGA